MLTYQVRPRVIRFVEPSCLEIVWPVDCEIRLHLMPLQPFGMMVGGGRTAVQNETARIIFNANGGTYTVESGKPLRPLEVEGIAPGQLMSLNGNVLNFAQSFSSLKILRETIESLYFCIPFLLNVDFADPPVVERVEGSIDGHAFRWELIEWQPRIQITNQRRQEASFAQAWKRLPLFADGNRRRLLAALHYFHVACRLERRGEVAGEFLAEVILNLAKTLDALFPPKSSERSMDAARSGLEQLGFTKEEIEQDYIPALALRNNVDVGHVTLALLKTDQLKTLQGNRLNKLLTLL